VRGSSDSTRPRINLPPWSRTAPSDTELHGRTFETQLFKRCSICQQRWFFGHRAHLTTEHQQGHPARGRRSNTTPLTPAPPASMPAVPAPTVHFAAPTDTDSNELRDRLFDFPLVELLHRRSLMSRPNAPKRHP
jgi:hypothetical protein